MATMPETAQPTTGAHDGHAKAHPYHLVDPSPWPFIGTIAASALAVGGLLVMKQGPYAYEVLGAGVLGVLLVMAGWWRSVLKESKHGDHTAAVSRGLRVGMALFIISEVFFFIAFFWAYFWAYFNPSEATGNAWPPAGIEAVDPWQIPLFNTLVLLLSGTTITWAHHKIVEGDQKTGFRALLLTVALGVLFTAVQGYEYLHAHFGMTDTVYGSTFYMATGFHGFHVIVGTTFLIVCMFRAYRLAFAPDRHVGLEAAAWYWHFVDVVWLFLFVSIYVWSGI